MSTAFPTALEWKFSQVFGERTPGEDVQDVDIVSTVEFEKRGDFLATGDRGGRIVIFERTDGKDCHSRKELEILDYRPQGHPEYRYKTEFQSHEPEFDYVRSVEIEERINRVRWCATPNDSLFILSTNDKAIKLWKVKDHKVKKVKQMELNPFVCSENSLLSEKSFLIGKHEPSFINGYHLEWKNEMPSNVFPSSHEEFAKIANNKEATLARCRKIYAHAHDFNINSISNNSDGEIFVSADDLRINLWNLEVSNQCFNIIDMKPSNMEDLTEVITSAEFHPVYCNLLAYSSSRGFIRLIDMRQSALCDHHARIYGTYTWKALLLQLLRFTSTSALSYLIYIITIQFLTNLTAASVAMGFILLLDHIAMLFEFFLMGMEAKKEQLWKLAKIQTGSSITKLLELDGHH
ncbi:PREDICTED: serine/threonine protein phosphatase 2A 55 kDa regulatory subunit B beta isoform-like isoform X3 [Nelumbo nucifera]|uniref:Serine/threonine-protein phosphatase 2A 55 kDa regulatory subunit B n=1 Tax=Nelumbo nucifera TaxID=4432 RepID=A0A1U7ZBK0_NELNU|nr:PREDICTED: serine/threonine protein phosphatase 2A 55 kDa regulatory subunit B beta isoform-like isoform X3 [Nelumbo nucifera]